MGNIGEDVASAGGKPTVFGTIIWMLFTRTGLIFTHRESYPKVEPRTLRYRPRADGGELMDPSSPGSVNTHSVKSRELRIVKRNLEHNCVEMRSEAQRAASRLASMWMQPCPEGPSQEKPIH